MLGKLCSLIYCLLILSSPLAYGEGSVTTAWGHITSNDLPDTMYTKAMASDSGYGLVFRDSTKSVTIDTNAVAIDMRLWLKHHGDSDYIVLDDVPLSRGLRFRRAVGGANLSQVWRIVSGVTGVDARYFAIYDGARTGGGSAGYVMTWTDEDHYVGLGTTQPTEKFHVDGNIKYSGWSIGGLFDALPDTTDFVGGETWISNIGDSLYTYISDHTIVVNTTSGVGLATLQALALAAADSVITGVIGYTRRTYLNIDANRQLSAAESGSFFVADDISAKRTYTLPTAAIGLEFSFMVDDLDSLIVAGAGANKIKNTVNAFAKFSAVNASITITAYNVTTWSVRIEEGTWTPY